MKTSLLIGLALLTFALSGQTYEIYVSDAGNFDTGPWQILKFDSEGNNPEVFIDNNLAWPQDIVFLEDSSFVLISNLNSGRINRHDSETGAFISTFASGIQGPTRMKIGADTLLYVLQWNGNGKVKRYRLDGTSLGDYTDVGVPKSIGLDWDDKGYLYVSSYTQDIVRKYNAKGEDMGLFINSNLKGPTNIWFDDHGDLLVSDYDGTAVKRFDKDGMYVNEFITGLSQSEGVDFFPNGDILIGNGKTSSVKLYNSAGVYQREFVPVGSGDLLRPNAVIIRELTTSSVKPVGRLQGGALYPTVGRDFYLRDAYREKVANVEVFNANGSLVGSYKPDGSLAWSADGHAAGGYVVLLRFEEGAEYSERVVVIK